MLPWKHRANQITINLSSLSITVIFLKAVLNIVGALFMIQYNAKKERSIWICLETRFLTNARPDKAHKLRVYEQNGTLEQLQRSVFAPSKLEVEVSKQIYI